jgi:hypothetical protein
MNPHYRGVAFLLSLGTLPVACNDKDPADTPGTTDTGNPPATDPSGTTTPVDPTTGPDGTASTSSTSTGPDPSDTSEDPSTTFLTTVTTTAPTEDTADTEEFPPTTNPVCISYVDHLVECNPRYAEYASEIGFYCEYQIAYGMRADGMACADAIEALFACLSTVPCGEDQDTTCMQQLVALEAACPSFGGSETSDTGDTFGETGDSSG